MAVSNKLNTASGGSSLNQTSTDNPQSATSNNAIISQSSNVQAGADSSVLNGTGSIQLPNTSLPAVGLGSANTGTSATITSGRSSHIDKHHISVPLFCLAALLIVAAFYLLWMINRSVKTTT